MGQSASKGLSKAAETAAKRAPSSSHLKRPQTLPSRASPAATATATETATATASREAATPEATHDNLASFLRGEGVGAHDIRDRGQELYLQHAQQQMQMKQQQQQQSQQPSPASSSSSSSQQQHPPLPPANTEMPEDLLKFITDVGPAKMTVDREFTTDRLLREENAEELNKAESTRSAKRERVRMPLMQGQDSSFTTEKNTNFSTRVVSSAQRQQEADDEHDFGLTNLQLYDMLSEQRQQSQQQQQQQQQLEEFHRRVVAETEAAAGKTPPVPADGASPSYPRRSKKKQDAEQLAKPREIELLSQALGVLEVPTLRRNADGDILGLYGSDVPGPEMTSIAAIPEDKIVLVLKDLSVQGTDTATDGAADGAAEKLGKRRQERKVI